MTGDPRTHIKHENTFSFVCGLTGIPLPCWHGIQCESCGSRRIHV